MIELTATREAQVSIFCLDVFGGDGDPVTASD
jgi:hypothetical protein